MIDQRIADYFPSQPKASKELTFPRFPSFAAASHAAPVVSPPFAPRLLAAVSPPALRLGNPLYEASDMGSAITALQSVASLGTPSVQPPPLSPSPPKTFVTVNELFATKEDTLPSTGIGCDNSVISVNSVIPEIQLSKHDAHRLSSSWPSACSHGIGSCSSPSSRLQASLQPNNDRRLLQDSTTSSSCTFNYSLKSRTDVPRIPAQKLVSSYRSVPPSVIPSSSNNPMSLNSAQQPHLATPRISAKDALTTSDRGSLQSITTSPTSPLWAENTAQKLSPLLQMSPFCKCPLQKQLSRT